MQRRRMHQRDQHHNMIHQNMRKHHNMTKHHIQGILAAAIILTALSACTSSPAGKAAEPQYADCQDADGGIIYDTQSKVYGTTLAGNPYEITDSCLTAYTVQERYCNDGRPTFINYNCKNMGDYECREGRCASIS